LRKKGLPVALTIAGSDSGGGAGVQADLRTFSSYGIYGTCVITAVTAQNTLGVTAIHEAPPQIVTAQIDAVFSDFNVGAVKIGMLPTVACVEAVARALKRHRPRFVVLDPVMVSSAGDPLVQAAALAVLTSKLLPLADCLTPNLAEAGALLGEIPAVDEEGMKRQGRALLALGPKAVLMKGGHLDGPLAVDLLVTPAGARRYPGARIASPNLHGTGCTLSAAIAASIIVGEPLFQAVDSAKEVVRRAIAAGSKLTFGSGPGPLVQIALRPAAPKRRR